MNGGGDMRSLLRYLNKKQNVLLKAGIFVFVFVCSLVCWTLVVQAGPTYKILHIMSYHAPWKWTDDQFNGFKYGLQDQDVEYKVVQMDAKQNNAPESLKAAAQKAKTVIETWQPDLVYANDDLAQEYVVKDYINSDIPFVFSGVNSNPIRYGFLGSKNITGIMEQEHFVETIKLLQKLVPEVKRIAVIFDEGSTWEGVGGRMLTKLPQLSDIQVTSWSRMSSFKEYKELISRLQTETDAIALLGIFGYKNSDGSTVPYTEVLRWTAENSRLPDFSFWKDRISYGTLCAVAVSGYEQGLAAGMLAREILVEGHSPSTLTIRPSLKGEPVISLARAKKLGINVHADLLLSSDVMTEFKWDK